MYRKTTILALAAGLASTASPVVLAQQPPSPQVLAMSSTPDEATRKSIQNFVDPQVKLIATGAPAKVEEARKALALVLRKPDCTLVFNRTFLQLAKPGIDEILKSGDGFRMTNALLVVRHVKCPEALDLMLSQASAESQADVRTRIAASGMIGAMIRGGVITPTEYDGAARRIRETLEGESNPLAASQLMEGISAIGLSAEGAKLPVQVRGAVDEIMKATNSAIDRASKQETADFAMVVYRGLISLRDLLVNMPSDQRSSLGRTIAPVLARVRELPAGTAGSNAAREAKAAKDSLPGLEGMVGLTPSKK